MKYIFLVLFFSVLGSCNQVDKNFIVNYNSNFIVIDSLNHPHGRIFFKDYNDKVLRFIEGFDSIENVVLKSNSISHSYESIDIGIYRDLLNRVDTIKKYDAESRILPILKTKIENYYLLVARINDSYNYPHGEREYLFLFDNLGRIRAIEKINFKGGWQSFSESYMNSNFYKKYRDENHSVLIFKKSKIKVLNSNLRMYDNGTEEIYFNDSEFLITEDGGGKKIKNQNDTFFYYRNGKLNDRFNKMISPDKQTTTTFF